jgi:hypothetical protein
MSAVRIALWFSVFVVIAGGWYALYPALHVYPYVTHRLPFGARMSHRRDGGHCAICARRRALYPILGLVVAGLVVVVVLRF